MTVTPKAIAQEFIDRARLLEDIARDSALLVQRSYVIRSSPGLYLKASILGGGVYRPTALQAASMLPEDLAKRLAVDLQDCGDRTGPFRKLVALPYGQALQEEAQSLRAIAEDVMRVAA